MIDEKDIIDYLYERNAIKVKSTDYHLGGWASVELECADIRPEIIEDWKQEKKDEINMIDISYLPKATLTSCDSNNIQVSTITMPSCVTTCTGNSTEEEIRKIVLDEINKERGENIDMAEERKICPKCGNVMTVKTSRYGIKFWGCSNYPDCKYTEDYVITTSSCDSCKQICNSSCACRDEQCDEVDRTPLEALFYGCDLKGIYINDKNGTITCVNTDGETFSAKISGSDEFDPRIGVALVLAYNFMGSKGSFNSAVKELMNSKRYHITKRATEKKETKEDAKENN